ncbi:MAG: hypothetical protein DWQ41_00515 [Planctomycetota bacterium]|nr:MAG: hypothetical protein DWQ41_00515 [Planctomycetota bacterium]
MGIHANFFVAGIRDAAIFDTNPDAFEPHTAYYKNLTESELSVLWAILTDTELNESMREFECIFYVDDGERFIVRLPHSMVEKLTDVDGSALEALTARWAGSAEMQREPDEVRPIVNDLRRLSKHAIETGQAVYLWNCC